ncbi:MAG: 50S ribosomal protein L13 [Patescibacteria group bacterium]
MEKKIFQHTVTIDATGLPYGRLASQVASHLRGKNLVTFKPNAAPDLKVIVTNLSKVKFSGDKLTTKIYYSFSGYPGGLKKATLGEKWAKQPERLFRWTVKHMLPKNRLSDRMIKNLQVYQGTDK